MVSSGTDDDTDTEHRPVLGTGVADDYVKVTTNMPEYSSVAEKLMVGPLGYVIRDYLNWLSGILYINMSNFPRSSNCIIHFATLVKHHLILEIGIKIIPVTVVEETLRAKSNKFQFKHFH